ncbi:DinB family protein [Tenacibaculum caenipelagi]|uniref:DinB family protein n=1 Tax=Tenacibaculum caenipelagi TaxID=1325435 RepID=A0A4R6TDS6_9FLAO|nr:DinB family protein [Tenacibaculum caenipelagi]TDQ27523.1 DinB family protein [Tenacibaculum caenipelagi]
MNNKLITNVISQLKNNLDGNNWLDENFKKKLKTVTETNAFIRPIPEVHSIAELVAHILIWRVEGIKKLQGIKSKVTMDSPENWRTNDELKKIGWKKLKEELFNSQTALIKLLEDKSDDFLEDNDYASGYSYKYLVDGLIHHDIYHMGQIGTTLKLLNKK